MPKYSIVDEKGALVDPSKPLDLLALRRLGKQVQALTKEATAQVSSRRTLHQRLHSEVIGQRKEPIENIIKDIPLAAHTSNTVLPKIVTWYLERADIDPSACDWEYMHELENVLGLLFRALGQNPKNNEVAIQSVCSSLINYHHKDKEAALATKPFCELAKLWLRYLKGPPFQLATLPPKVKVCSYPTAKNTFIAPPILDQEQSSEIHARLFILDKEETTILETWLKHCAQNQIRVASNNLTTKRNIGRPKI